MQCALTDAILALGLLFTTASQLRMPGLPLGPGELGLVVWIATVIAKHLASGEPLRSSAVFVLMRFWAAFAVGLSFGMLVAMAKGEQFESDLVLHDAEAYVLTAVMSCLATAAPVRLRRVSWILVSTGALSLSLQLANGADLFRIDGVDPWFWERLRGWSSNPNQLSIICLILTLLAWYLADSATNIGARLAALALMAPALVAGRLSQSDTFLIALAVALPVWIVLKLAVHIRNEPSPLSLRASLARIALVAGPMLILAAVPLLLTESQDLKGFMMGFAKKGGTEAAAEAELRMSLWEQAIERGVGSGMLGLGPGPHLEIPATITAGRVNSETQSTIIVNPSQNGTANYEAHNTLLDVFTQAGILGVASLVWLLIHAVRCAYRAQAVALVSLLTGVATFMMTGNIARQPIFWFALVLCLRARADLPKPELQIAQPLRG